MDFNHRPRRRSHRRRHRSCRRHHSSSCSGGSSSSRRRRQSHISKTRLCAILMRLNLIMSSILICLNFTSFYWVSFFQIALYMNGLMIYKV